MNNLIIIGLLIGCSNKVFKLNDKPLLEAVKDGNLLELKESLKNENVNHDGTDGTKALMEAAKEGHVNAIRALIEAGDDVNEALMLASEWGHLLSFMKAYAKIKFNLPDDVYEHILVNSAFILLLQLLYAEMCINQVANMCAITHLHIHQFLSDPLIDLSALVTHTTNDITIHMNSVQIIYKNLLPDAFDAIYNSDQKDQMLDIIKGWDIPTKRKMLKHIFKDSNSRKLNSILTNTQAKDPEANEKRSALKEMVKMLLVDGLYSDKDSPELKPYKALIYKIFQDELDEKIIIELLYNRGWR